MFRFTNVLEFMLKDILSHPFLISLLLLVVAFVLKVLVDKLAKNRAEKKKKTLGIYYTILSILLTL